MVFKFIKKIKDVTTIFNLDFEKGIKIGLIIYYSNETFTIISKTDFNLLFHLKDNLGSYHIFGKRIFVRKQSTIYEVDINTKVIKYFCSTQENRISIHNLTYFSGVTSQRKPRLKRGEIIQINDGKCEIIYKWVDEKNILTIEDRFVLFYSRDNKLILFDINQSKDLWNLKLDNGSFGQRILGQTENIFYLQRAVEKPNLFNVLALEKSTGKIIWETENTHPYYCFDEEKNKLYGLGGKRFEVIDTLTGVKELVTELDIKGYISSHLTFYNDGFLYFSTHINKNTPVFGAVNVKTGKLDFIQKVKIEGEKSFRIGLEKPIVVGNRLYVKDSLNNLHIFEKTQNETT